MIGLPKVLIAEDDDAVRSLLVAALRNEPLEIDAVPDGAEALELTTLREYAVIIVDLMMPRLNGFDFLDAFRKAHPRARSILFVVTAFDDLVLGKLDATQVHAVIRKPFDVEALVMLVRESALAWVRETAVADGAAIANAPRVLPRGTSEAC